MSMTLGEKATLTITSEYGYGPVGSPPKIPGGATLIFDVELIQISDRRPTRFMMSDPELIQVALRFKEDGNIKFKAQQFAEAEGLYTDALLHANKCKNKTDELDKLKVVIS